MITKRIHSNEFYEISHENTLSSIYIIKTLIKFLNP